jgi:CheY-like chemotaxis protein
VRIYLPRTRRAEDVAAPAVFRPIEGGKEMVLVVEDDEAVRDTVVGMLADLGYRVLKANDAQAASVVIESGVPIDVLFTDVVMPGPLRSTDLAKIAREKLPKIAILFTSGYTDKAIVHGGYLDEGTHLLSKPYTKEALARKLRHVVNNQEQKAITSSPHPNLNPVPSSLAVGKQLRVLFVEDEPLIRAVTADLLSELGHTVMEAKDAAAAMKILAAEEVDLLLTDVNLPGQSGIDLALQSRRRFPNIMVVLATGYGSIPDREGLPGAVMLTKPYEITDIAKALHSVADSETARRVDLADVKDSKAIKSALRHST